MSDTELEDQLAALFERRASDIRTEPAIDFPAADSGRSGLNLTPFAVAASIAAVVLVAGGSIVGIRSIHHAANDDSVGTHVHATTPTPTARPTTCAQVKARTTWQTPIENGMKVALDHPENQVVSVNGRTGEYLLLQSTPATASSSAVFGQATLAVFRDAAGQDIAVLPAGSTDLPTVDPAGALSSGAIAYGLAHPQNAGTYYKVQLYDRATRATTTVAQLDDSALADGQIYTAAPIVFGHRVYWIQSIYSDRSKSVLKSYDLQTGAVNSTPVPGAISLVDYGIGLATVAGSDTDSVFTTRVGTSLPETSLAALQGASSYSYNAPRPGQTGAGSLAWTKATTSRGQSVNRYYQIPDVSRAGLTYFQTPDYTFEMTVGTGQFAAADPIGAATDGLVQVLDAREAAGGFHQLPAGDTLQAVVGDTAIFGTGSTKLGSSGLVLLKVASLPQHTAGC